MMKLERKKSPNFCKVLAKIQGKSKTNERVHHYQVVFRTCKIYFFLIKFLYFILHSGNDERLRERERENAATFVRVLRNRVARLNTIRSGPEIDQKIQEFSTQFCQVKTV